MINKNADGITVGHSKSVIAPIGPNDYNNNNILGPITIKTSYQNDLSVEIVVVERNGLRQVVKPNNRTVYNKSFIIKTEYFVKPEAYRNLEILFSQLDYSDDNEFLTKIKESYFHQIENKQLNGMNIVIFNLISIEDLKEASGNLYLSTNDVIVSTLPMLEAAAHPFNSNSISSKDFEGMDVESNVSLNIEIIDNTGTIGNRYILLAKDIYTLTPKKSDSKIDGIYIANLEKDISTKSKKKIKVTRYDFKDAEEILGIYKTKEDCVSGGDIKTLRKEGILQMEHDFRVRENELKLETQEIVHAHLLEVQEINSKIEIQKAENLKLKSTLEEITLKRKEEIDKIEHEHQQKLLKQQTELNEINTRNKILEAIDERRRAEMKDFYESRSHDRKDNSELIKFLPVIITGCLAIVTIFVKFKIDANK